MEVKREDLKGSEVKLTIDVPAGQLHLYSEEVYKKLAPSVKISGFRPGKAPRHLVEQEVGSDVFNKEILEMAIQRSFYEAITKEKLTTVSPPEVKVVKFVPTDGLTYEATVTILPEIKLPDFKAIKLKKKEIKADEGEVDKVLENLKKQHSIYKEVKREAKDGDKVEIDFAGTIKNVPFDGGTSKNHPVVLGSKTMIPGFEKGIEGMKVGEEKEVKVTFPKDYHAAQLAGKEVNFKIKLNKLEEVILPEVDDDLAKKTGPFKTVKELKDSIKKELEQNAEVQEQRNLEEELLNKAVTASNIEAPKSLVDGEVKRMAQESEHNLSHSGIELDKYLEHSKKTREEFEEDMRPEAEKRVAVGLLFSEVVREQKLEATEKEISEEIDRIVLHTMPEKQEEAKGYYEQEEGKRGLENNVLTRKAMEWMTKQASIEK